MTYGSRPKKKDNGIMKEAKGNWNQKQVPNSEADKCGLAIFNLLPFALTAAMLVDQTS